MSCSSTHTTWGCIETAEAITHLLRDVLAGGADPADHQEDVLAQEVPGQDLHQVGHHELDDRKQDLLYLDLFGEGSREHHGLPAVVGDGHVVLLHDAADLGLEAHVQHPVGLVQAEELAALEADLAPLQEVHQAAGRGDEQVAAPVQLPELVPDVGAAVGDSRADPGAVAELARLLVDLAGELAGGGEHQGQRVLLPAAPVVVAAAGLLSGRSLLADPVQDRDEEGGSLAGAGLGAGHQVPLGEDHGDGVLLHRRRLVVLGEVNVGFHDGRQAELGGTV